MKNDGYIHRNLLRHMLRAGLIEEAQQLIRDLKWLAAKLDVTGPADLLNDYLAVKGHEDSKVTTQHHKECFKWPKSGNWFHGSISNKISPACSRSFYQLTLHVFPSFNLKCKIFSLGTESHQWFPPFCKCECPSFCGETTSRFNPDGS